MWSRDSAAEFIQRHFGEGVAGVFAKCKIPAMQADLFRYCILLREGGIYLDSDAIAHLPFHQWLDPAADIALPITNIADPVKPGLGNGFIATEANNPLLAFALGQCVHNVSRETENNIARVTGPRTLHCALKLRRTCNPQLIDPRDNYLDNFNLVVKGPAGHWSVRQQTENIFLDLPGAVRIESPNELRYSLGQVINPVAEEVMRDIVLGYRYAEFEWLLAGQRDTRESLAALLESGGDFNFESLRGWIDGAAETDFESYDECVKRWRIALLKEQLHQFDTSLALLVKSILDVEEFPDLSFTLDSYSPGLWFHAARQLDAQNHCELAVNAIRRALDILVYDRNIWITAARLFCNSQRNHAARNCALEVLQREGGNTVALHYLARAYDQDGQLELARQTAERLVTVANSEDAYLQLIRILLRLQELPDAIRMLIKAKSLFPDSLEISRLLEDTQ